MAGLLYEQQQSDSILTLRDNQPWVSPTVCLLP